jgi:hypothetical protein
MIIAVLSLGGAILGATALAGFLTLYTIRSGTDYRNSAEAIFAADSGVNWILYNFVNSASAPQPTLSNGVTLNVICYDASGNQLGSCSDPAVTSAFSEGTSNGSRRAFSVNLEGATTTVP